MATKDESCGEQVSVVDHEGRWGLRFKQLLIYSLTPPIAPAQSSESTCQSSGRMTPRLFQDVETVDLLLLIDGT